MGRVGHGMTLAVLGITKVKHRNNQNKPIHHETL